MNRKTILTQKQSVALIRHFSVGGVTALLLVLLFLAGAGESDPNWASLWWIRPIVIVTLAGAMGGSWFYFMYHHMISNKLPRIIVVHWGTSSSFGWALFWDLWAPCGIDRRFES